MRHPKAKPLLRAATAAGCVHMSQAEGGMDAAPKSETTLESCICRWLCAHVSSTKWRWMRHPKATPLLRAATAAGCVHMFQERWWMNATSNENCRLGALACRERHIAAVQYVVSHLGYHVRASMLPCMLAAISIACSKITCALANASWLARNPPAKCNSMQSTWDPVRTSTTSK